MIQLSRVMRAWFLGGVRHRVRAHCLAIAYFRDRKMRTAAQFVEARLQRKYGVFVSHKAAFPASLRLKHPVGIVIGEGVHIDEDVTIFQNVTLGGARMGDSKVSAYPSIGRGTVIFAGAVIVGAIRVGEGCVIGANAVVTRDVPDHSTAVGVPARVLTREREGKEIGRN